MKDPYLNLETHLEQFAECVRESKRPIGLFLGAGCAKSLSDENGDPLIPDTKGMTAKVAAKVRSNGLEECWDIITEDVQQQTDGDPPNIEDVLSQVRGIRQYAESIGREGLSTESLESLEEEICSEIIRLVNVDLPDEDSGYTDIANWLASTNREEPVEIFTTNYDLLIEEALESERIPYFDGFVGGYRPFFDRYSVANDELPSHWVRLWKIHGSMNWRSTKDGGSLRTWRSNQEVDEAVAQRAVIHPSHRKYDESRKMPYLSLIDRLKEFLKREESVLFVVGYSFGDDHLNDVLLQALRESPSSSIFAFMYGELDDNDNVTQLAESHPNFGVFGRDGCIVGSEHLEWNSITSESKPEQERKGIDWREAEEEWCPEFTLGNFREFGKFMSSATGEHKEGSDE